MAPNMELCFPVLKFSHATGVRSDNTIPWTHLSASDLYVVVDGVSTRRLGFRIIQKTTVLENVDVGRYVDQAIEARRTSDHASERIQVERLPIFGMTKESLLAMRYRLSDGQACLHYTLTSSPLLSYTLHSSSYPARRLQVRLQNPAECRQIVTVLEQRGMEFQEQRPRTARPGTSERPDTALDRPSTAQKQPDVFTYCPALPQHELGRGNFKMDVIEAGSLSRHSNSDRGTEISNPQFPSWPGPAQHQSLPRSQHILGRDEMTAPREVAPDRPSTAQIYRSFAKSPQSKLDHAAYSAGHVQGSAGDPPGSFKPQETSSRPRIDLGYYQPSLVSERLQPVSTRSMDGHESGQARSCEAVESMTPTLPSESSEIRPQTAQTAISSWSLPSLEHEIPPRRVLPFTISSAKSPVRPATASASTTTLAPLPKPTLVKKETSASPTRPNTASLTKDTPSSLKRPFIADEIQYKDGVDFAEPPRPSTMTGATTNHGTRPASSQANRELFMKTTNILRCLDEPNTREKSPFPKLISSTQASTSPARTASRMDELLYGRGRRSLAERSTKAKVPRLDSLADAPHEIVPPPSTSHSPNKTTFEHGAATTVSPVKLGRDGMQETSLADYAAQSREDREAAMEAFFMQKLQDEDESFMRLCEDVEGSWRRVALGL